MPTSQPLLTASYDPTLVAISFLIAVGAAYTALDLAERVTVSKGRAQTVWLLAGGLTMGLGIWSMHFTGMLAFKLPVDVPMSYDLVLTLMSMVVPVLASVLALYLASRKSMGTPQLIGGGLLMGVGIASMHYTGMAAMQAPCVMTYTPVLFAASIVIAIAASIGALYLAFQLRSESLQDWSWRRISSASLMGVAISGMHYTGMTAAVFTPFCKPAINSISIKISDLGASAIAFGTLMMLSVALISSHKERLQRQQDVLKDRFLSILSHELRTPINAIMGFASILDDEVAGTLTPEQHVYVRKILSGADKLLYLVNDLLDMSRIQAGKFSLSPSATRLPQVVADVLATLDSLARQKQLRLVNAVPDDLPELFADGQRLGQVLMNLVSNAIKFTPDGGVIVIQARHQSGQLRVEVTDTGIGIAPEDLDKLFRPFTQLDMSSTRKAGGTGLGLSISKALIEAHGGTIGALSQSGQGATFWFELPIEAKPQVPVFSSPR